MYASVGLVTINEIPITTSQAMFAMQLKDKDLLDYLYYYLGQFTRNYTQTVKRAADNKRRYAPGWVHSTCLLRGFPKGCPLWHTTLLAKCSVLYLLAWLTGETGCGASCAPFAPAGKQAEFLRMGMSKKSACFQRTAAGI